jgi:hypothetical protein
VQPDFHYLHLADLILVVHFLFVLFVVGGLVAIYTGAILNWPWVRSFRFRVAHLAAITFVVVQAWCGAICPLTRWEMDLRERGGGAFYEGSFIQHWVQRMLYFDAPDWVFVILYTGFGLLVAASWWIVEPRRNRSRGSADTHCV